MEEVIIEFTRKNLAEKFFDSIEEIFGRIQELLQQFEALVLTAQEVLKVIKQVFDYVIEAIAGYRAQLN